LRQWKSIFQVDKYKPQEEEANNSKVEAIIKENHEIIQSNSEVADSIGTSWKYWKSYQG